MAVKKATKKATTEKAAGKKEAAKKAPAKKAAPAKKQPAKKAPVTKKAPAKKVPAKKAPTKEAVKQEAPKKESPKKEAPKKELAKSAAPAKAAAPEAPKPAPKTLGQKRDVAPRPTTAGLDKEFLAEQKAELKALREEYLTKSEEYEAEADLLAQELETGDVGFDEEAGEGGAATVDRERNLVLSAQARQTATEIDDAVRRIDKGSYGLCLHCGQKIPKMRLKAIPHAELCVDCKAGGLLRRR